VAASPVAGPPSGDAASGDGPVAGAAPRDAPRPLTLLGWLRERTDRQLVELLRLRPDLALPAPPDVSALASRLGVRTSVQRAVDGLDARTLAALEALVLAAADDDTVDDPDPGGLDALFDLALIWGAPDLVHLVPTARDALGPYPGGLGRPAAVLLRQAPDTALVPVLRELGIEPVAQPRAGAAVAARLTDPAALDALIAAADAGEREVLGKLAAGPPVGTVRSVLPSPDTAAGRLMTRGLLVPIDSTRVELPREVGLAVRGSGARPATAPEVPVRERTPRELDSLGTTAVASLLRLVDTLAASWTTQPPSLLRSGGIGVRELRRTARDLDVDEATAAVVVEVAYAAGLINSTNGVEPVYLPTADYDAWAQRDAAARWITLVTAWLAMTRQPSLINQRGERDRVINALGPDVERGTVPALRRHVLDTLAALAPGSAPTSRDTVLALLAWQQPRRAAGQRPVADAILREADLLGVTAAGGVTGWTRTLLDGGTGPVVAAGASAAAEHALAQALPLPVDHFLVQPDLTVVVPGPPDRTIAGELDLLADLESTGGASVYRITERSIRRALDAGRDPSALAQFLAVRSRTPVPQALDYLLDDAARRHGILRAGRAGSYLRCEDESLLARVLADKVAARLGLRLLAPTVVVADVPINQLLDGLRDAGFAPAAEAADGRLVTLEVEPQRAPARPATRIGTPRGDGDGPLAETVRRMRIGDEAQQRGARVQPIAAGVPGVTSASTMELLRRAVREERTVQLGCAEPDGRATVHLLQPISLAAGSVRGYESGRPGLVAYPVHRITSVQLVSDPDDE